MSAAHDILPQGDIDPDYRELYFHPRSFASSAVRSDM